MTESGARYPGGASSSIKDIPYHTLERERVKDNALLLYMIATEALYRDRLA